MQVSFRQSEFNVVLDSLAPKSLLYNLLFDSHFEQVGISFSPYFWLIRRASDTAPISDEGAGCMNCPIRRAKFGGFFRCHGVDVCVLSAFSGTECLLDRLLLFLLATACLGKTRRDPQAT